MKRRSDILNQARALLEAGDAEAADALLEGLDDLESQFLKAQITCARGEHLEAIRLYRQLVSIHPSAECYYQIGTCWQHVSEWEASEKALMKAVSLDPKHTDAFILLGTAYYQLERHPEAVKAFERALVNDPHALVARYYLAQVCMELGNFKRALTQLHVLQTLQPDYPPAHRLQAAIFLKLKDYRQALVELCWLVESGNADVWCFSSMGTAYRAIGEKLQALKAFEYALRLDPDLTDEAFYTAQLNEELEQYEVALELYKPLIHDLTWGERANAAIERLERRMAVVRLQAKPPTELPEFSGFQAPAVSQQPTAPLRGETKMTTQPLHQRYEPLGIQEVEYEGPPPLLERLKRNLAEITGGRLDIEELKERSQEVLEKIPLDAFKEKLPDAIKKLPLDKFFGNRKP